LASLSGQSLASAEAEAAARFGLTDDQRKRVVVGSPMKLESNITVFEDRGVSGQWRVEYVDEDGGSYVTRDWRTSRQIERANAKELDVADRVFFTWE
jgi:hypothetical protein